MCIDCINDLAKKYSENNTETKIKPTLFVSPEEVDKMRNEVLKMDFRLPKTIEKEANHYRNIMIADILDPEYDLSKTLRRIKTAQEEDDLIKNLVGMDDDLTDSDETIEKSLNKIRKENVIALEEVAKRNKPAYLRRYEYDRKQESIEYDREQKTLTRKEINKQLDYALKSLPTPEEELALVKKTNKLYKNWSIPGSLLLYYFILSIMCFVFAIPFSFIGAIVGTILSITISYLFQYKPAKKKIRIAEEKYNRIMEPIWDKIIEEDDQEQYQNSEVSNVRV